MRLGLRRAAYWAQYARAPDTKPEPAAASDHVERRRGTLKVKRGHPPGPRMRCGWGLRRPAYWAQYARALHNMPEAAWQPSSTGPESEELEG
jgi:hypothetical protein